MLDVLLTIDVEIWCGGWDQIDAKFPGAFRKYIYGSTSKGDFGLPYQLRVLDDHNLPAVFFVEPLFSSRFGPEPLQEIVELITMEGQEIQLHLHPEWVDEAIHPIIADSGRKRQHLRYFTLEEQILLISRGLDLLEKAGAPRPVSFRAGSFAFNRDTITACRKNHILFDSSYNASMHGLDSGVMPGKTVVEPVELDGVYEYPMTVFNDGSGTLRHVQLTACSFREIEYLLWQALEQERKGFVILSHGFELLDLKSNRPDKLVIQRFLKLCRFLEKNSDSFRVGGFRGTQPQTSEHQPTPLKSSRLLTYQRIGEQARRRLFN